MDAREKMLRSIDDRLRAASDLAVIDLLLEHRFEVMRNDVPVEPEVVGDN